METVACLECQGRGYLLRCSGCQGKGSYFSHYVGREPSFTTCKVCKGSGFGDGKYHERCSKCNGNGKFEAITCTSCKGEGGRLMQCWCGGTKKITYTRKEKVRCPDCGGTGKTKWTCPRCNGSGRVTEDVQVEKACDCDEEGKRWVPCYTCGGRGYTTRTIW